MRPLRTVVLAAVLLVAPQLYGGVSGVVVDEDGRSVSAASVAVFQLETHQEAVARWMAGAPRTPQLTAETDREGRFALAATTPVVDLLVTAEGFAPLMLRTIPDDAGVVMLQRAAMKRGKVTSAGAPLAGTTVIARSPTGAEVIAKTAADGSYSLPDPALWVQVLTFFDARHARRTLTRMRPDDPPIVLDQQLSPAALRSGHIIGGDDAPVGGAVLDVAGWIAGTSAQDGVFTALLPEGSQPMIATSEAGEAPASTLGNSAAFVTGDVIRLAPGATLSGTIVPGVDVRLRDRNGTLLRSAVTGSDGAWRIAPLPAGSYILDAERPDYAFAPLQLSLRAGEAQQPALRGVALARISGQVFDPRGAPIALARVIAVQEKAGGVVAVSVSGPDGRYVLPAVDPSDSVRLTATKAGFERGHSPLVALRGGEQRARLNLVMQQGVRVTGRIRDAEQRPIDGATIRFAHRDDPTLAELFPAVLRSGSLGEVAVTLPRGRYRIRIEAPRFAPALVELLAGDEGANFEALLQPAAALTGRVVRTGVGIEGVTVRVLDTPAEVTTATDRDGAFAFSGLAVGNVKLSFRNAAEMIDEVRDVEVPGNVVIDLAAGVRVSGTVVDAATKQPIRTFEIQLQRDPMSPAIAQRFDSSSGEFTLEHVPPGTIALIASADGYAQSKSPPLEVRDEPLENITLSLTTAGSVIGVISGAGGAFVSGARIELLAGTGDARFNATSDAEGRYAMAGVPRGPAVISVHADDYVSVRDELTVDKPATRHDLTLQRGAELAGQVIGSDGPVAGADVMAEIAGMSTVRVTSGDGTFRFGSLQRGRYRVWASKAGFAASDAEEVDVPGAAPLTLQLRRSGVIVGHISGIAAGVEAVVVAAGASGTTMTRVNAAGDFRLEDVPAGRVTVVAQMEANGVDRLTQPVTIEVIAGAEVRVELGEWQR